MQYTKFELFKMLLEHELEYHNNQVFHKKEYQVEMEVDGNDIILYEKEGTTAHCLDQFIKMADACRFNYYLWVYERKDGSSIPALKIF